MISTVDKPTNASLMYEKNYRTISRADKFKTGRRFRRRLLSLAGNCCCRRRRRTNDRAAPFVPSSTNKRDLCLGFFAAGPEARSDYSQAQLICFRCCWFGPFSRFWPKKVHITSLNFRESPLFLPEFQNRAKHLS